MASNLLYLLIPAGVVGGIYLIRKLREFQWGWVRNPYPLKDEIYIVTGANTGLGFETTRELFARNATVVMACRNLEKASEAIAKIRRSVAAGGELIALELDLSSFESIHKFANEIKAKFPKFRCLINNAGLAVKTPQLTKEGYELHFGTNQLGPFLLTNLLMDNIKTNGSRVVIVSSKMHEKGKIDLEHLGKWVESQSVSRTNPYYNNSKLANYYFARELYKRGIDVHVCCPGLCNTDFFRDYNPKWYHYVLFSPVVWLMLRSARQGAQNIVHCATDNQNTEEKNPEKNFIVINLKQQKSKANIDDNISIRLWEECEKMAKLK